MRNCKLFVGVTKRSAAKEAVNGFGIGAQGNGLEGQHSILLMKRMHFSLNFDGVQNELQSN